ncbi:MAG: class I SAM-dependent methyltransferase, partial [Rhizobiaceae bacterium]|nr:class I SAM-dependent methyltransferase [Rhizobiaceae bacterium]
MKTDHLFSDPFLAGIYDVWNPRKKRKDYDFYLGQILAADAVLDVGCGTGTLLHEARDRGHAGRLCGLDPAPAMLEYAQRRTDIEWFAGDLQSADPIAEFDLIVMSGHAFQAIVSDSDLRDFTASIRQALVPGGQFIFETRNPLACAWKDWTSQNAETVEAPGGVNVRITTELIKPFDGQTLTFAHSFSGDHPSLPQISHSTLRF